ncbi:hypothetical protein OAU_10945 [Vibrio cyclitrophicus ZF99]|nr:hypothetical protein OAU_10945 [Vibrio cyclitrophicus ZF99]PME23804.1 hypothetical protein BCV43_00230 [Vibrio cyclitrophicus]
MIFNVKTTSYTNKIDSSTQRVHLLQIAFLLSESLLNSLLDTLQNKLFHNLTANCYPFDFDQEHYSIFSKFRKVGSKKVWGNNVFASPKKRAAKAALDFQTIC